MLRKTSFKAVSPGEECDGAESQNQKGQVGVYSQGAEWGSQGMENH